MPWHAAPSLTRLGVGEPRPASAGGGTATRFAAG